MKNILLILSTGLLFLLFSCKTKQAFVASNKDAVPIFCGTFKKSDSSGIVMSLKFKDWNTVAFTTTFDNIMAISNGKLIRPDSRYFVSSDTLFIEADKGFLCFKIKDNNTLLGLAPWIDNEKLIRQKGKQNTCPQTHIPTETEKTWLRQSRLYYQAFYGTDYNKALLDLEQLCEEGYGSACMTLGLFISLKDKEKGLVLLEKACDLGYYGSYACFRLGQILEKSGKSEAAKTAFQKACDGGHEVACFTAKFMNAEKK